MVLFIYPCKDNPLSSPPLGLLHLSSILKKSNISSEIYCTSSGFANIDLVDDIEDHIKDDTVCCGFSVMTGPQISEALTLSKQIREKHPGITIIWGGIHPTLTPEQTIENEYIDIVCVGEFERTITKLVLSIQHKEDLSKIPGIYYKVKGKVQKTEADPENFDLDELPLLSYEDLSLDKFQNPTTNPFYKFSSDKVATIEITRGCPLSCYYCVQNNFRTKFRCMSIDNMIRHLRNIWDIGFRALVIADDNFFVNTNAMNYIRAIIASNLKFEVYVSIPVTILYNMLPIHIELLQKCGIKTIGISAETGSDRMLKIIGKKHKTDMVLTINRRLRDFDIIVNYNFIAGFPEETLQDIKCTYITMINLLLENGMAQVNIKKLIPTPNTDVYTECVKRGMPKPSSLNDWVSYVDLKWERHHEYVDPKVEKWYKDLEKFHEELFWFCYIHNTVVESDPKVRDIQEKRIKYLVETIKNKI